MYLTTSTTIHTSTANMVAGSHIVVPYAVPSAVGSITSGGKVIKNSERNAGKRALTALRCLIKVTVRGGGDEKVRHRNLPVNDDNRP